jgi:CMP-N-acetylneuraminic acid synthetase
MRPAELAADDTPSLPVVQHAIQWLEARGDCYDAVCQLQPTSPLRTGGEIDACIDLLDDGRIHCVMTVVRVPAEYNPHWVYFCDAEGLLHLSTGESTPIPRRQELPPAYFRDGSVYVTRRDTVIGQNSLYGSRVAGMVVDGKDRVNLDRAEDFERAEAILRRRTATMAPADSRIAPCVE